MIMSPNLGQPSQNITLPVDGKSYYFKKFDVGDTPVDLLTSEVVDALENQIINVSIEVITNGTIGISVNGVPDSAAEGKTVQQYLPWNRRMKFDSLSAVMTSDDNASETVEVEYFTGE